MCVIVYANWYASAFVCASVTVSVMTLLSLRACQFVCLCGGEYVLHKYVVHGEQILFGWLGSVV